MSSWMITGANGNLGKRLITTLLEDPLQNVHAVVRSDKAANSIKALDIPADQAERLQLHVLNYTDVEALKAVALKSSHVVHLVGILKETASASYEDAHENSTRALLEAVQDTGVEHITYLSIVGSSPSAANACLASKGAAEQLLLNAPVAACVLRVPMVLGEGDYASFALKKRAVSKLNFSFRAVSLEQPIYAGDVISAILAARDKRLDEALDLGGPEILSRADLNRRAAAALNRQTTTLSLPFALGHAMAWLFSRLMSNPPVTPAMLGVLDHDDNVDPAPALQLLGIAQLTPLDDMLGKVLG